MSDRLQPALVGGPLSRLAWISHRPAWLPGVVTAAALLPVAFLYGQGLHRLGAEAVSGLAVLAILVSATVSSIAGFAFSALCGGLLLYLLRSPALAVQVMLTCSIGIQLLSVWQLRRQIEWRWLPRFFLGGALGLPAGLWLLLHLRREHYAGALGGLLILYGLWMLCRRPGRPRQAPRWTAILAGALGGVTGGMAALPGPAAMIWCSLQGWEKARQRGLMQAYILGMQLLALAALATLGAGPALPAGAGWAALAYLPAALLGTWLGLALFRRLSDGQFAAIVNAMLIVSGLALLL
ncbi:sulfite exporter TauE/SafE family protein [Roseicella frigidaeris]|nr:sulfite exporter TauE/SafE family protein [Roseicella frigidaeris]